VSSEGDLLEKAKRIQPFGLRPQMVAHSQHRNLRSRKSMLAQVLQIFLGKEHLVKNWLISTLDKVIYIKVTIFQRPTKPLFASQNRMEISFKKFSLFFKHASSSVGSS
jgi:hypothetical protein